jgi:hypothetical protein
MAIKKKLKVLQKYLREKTLSFGKRCRNSLSSLFFKEEIFFQVFTALLLQLMIVGLASKTKS